MKSYNRDTDRYITSRALELFATGNYSEAEMADIITEETGINVSRNVVHGRVYRHKTTSGLEEKPRTILPYFTKYEHYIRGTVPPVAKVDYDVSSGPLKILVLNDLHTPFQHEEAVEAALVANKSPDIVVTSEVTDMYSVTSFAKYQHVSFEQEVEEIIRWFEYLSENYPLIIAIGGGHERRLPKYVLSRIKSDMLFLVETDILKVLARPFGNIIVTTNPWYQINDALFTHIDKHSATIPMRSADKVHAWVQAWRPHLEDISDYSILVQAHSHHSGIINLPDVQLVETGCLQRIPEWVMYRTPMLPWTHGWCVVYQNDGVTDLNATQLLVYRE